MTTQDSTSPNTKLERKLDAFAQYLCARRGLAECTMADYLVQVLRTQLFVSRSAASVDLRGAYPAR